MMDLDGGMHGGEPVGQGGANASGVLGRPILPEELGHVTLEPVGDFEAGSFQSFTLVYTAGKYGIDDSGSLRVCWRFASDQMHPQFDDPAKPNFTTITASNKAVLQYRYDPKGNVRPWDRTLGIKVVHGFLKEGDTITIRFGVRDQGSPGMRIQTFCEDSFEFRVLVDPIATFNFQTLPQQPVIRIVPGLPDRYLAVIPSERRLGQPFRLSLKGEDAWGNPSDKCAIRLFPKPDRPVAGLPDHIDLTPGQRAFHVDGLSIVEPGVTRIRFENQAGDTVCEAGPIRILEQAELQPYWVDLHGQSEETIGTGSARQFFEFARDLAFVDAVGHQGNDFQITREFWNHLDGLAAEFDEPGRFLAIPGYEWSGNTGLGGDRNIFFPNEGRVLRRSSHALVEDRSDIDTDCNTAQQLFDTLAANGEWDVVCYAHCGGRYADIAIAHDGRFEKSMEIHSSWGTFEWLMQDAFRLGHRVGIVANSDGHKGRPGASYPGASLFGAIGGLTCLMLPELNRDALFDCIRKRRHYATTGGPGGRPIVQVTAALDRPGALFHDDPKLGPAQSYPADTAMMGDIVQTDATEVTFSATIHAAVPIERVDIFDGLELIETLRPYGQEELGARIRVMWEGAEYRGRFRQVIWDGTAHVTDNSIARAVGFNFFNPDRTLTQDSAQSVAWRGLTTGNIGGFDLWLADPYAGTLKIETPLVKAGVPIEDIGFEDEVFDRSGDLPRYLKLFRLPDANPHRDFSFTRRIPLRAVEDTRLFIRVTLEDGTLVWTSPIYLIR